MRQEHVPERTGVLSLTPEKGVYTIKSDQSAAIHLTDLSPNQQKPVQSEAKMGNGGGQKPVSTQGNVLQAKGWVENLKPNIIQIWHRFLGDQWSNKLTVFPVASAAVTDLRFSF